MNFQKNMSVFDIFKQLKIFRGVRTEELFDLIPRISLDFETFNEGEIIFEKDSTVGGLSFILSGKVEIFDQMYSAELHVNDVLSFTGLFSENASYQYDAKAIEDCRLLTIDRKSLVYLFKTNELILQNYLSLLDELAVSTERKAIIRVAQINKTI